MREYLLTLFVAAAVTYLVTPLVRRLALSIGAIHEPRERDVHLVRTPLLGGVAMYCGLAAALLVADHLGHLNAVLVGSRVASGLLLAGGVIVVMGVVDDRWGMSAIAKLAGQAVAGGILVWSGTELSWLPSPHGNVIVLTPDQGLVLTILVVVITINAVNFIDGLDGLAAGIVGIAALAFFAYSYELLRGIGDSLLSLPALISAILVGICVGFLPHNFSPARIFMGDTGSMLLGLLLAYGPIASTATLDPNLLVNYGRTHTVDRFATILPILLPVAIFLIPYADLTLAVVRRNRAGAPLFVADKGHLHHRLLNIGHSQRKSVLIMYLWAAVFAVAVVSLSVVQTQLVYLAIATVGCVLVLLFVTLPRLRPRLPGRRPPVTLEVPSPAPLPPNGSTPLSSPNGTAPVTPLSPAVTPTHTTAPITPPLSPAHGSPPVTPPVPPAHGTTPVSPAHGSAPLSPAHGSAPVTPPAQPPATPAPPPTTARRP